MPPDGAAIAPILYSFRRCPYAMRARLALIASGTVCVLREVALRDKPAEMLVISPKGTVPVLVLPGGQVIDESLDIMRWALGWADPGGWLTSADDPLIAANDGAFKHHLDRYKYPDRHGTDPLAHRAAALALLAPLEARLALSADLAGARPSFVDMALMPFVRQFAGVDAAWFAARRLPAVRGWLDRHQASPLFARAMARQRPWRPGDAAATLGETPLAHSAGEVRARSPGSTRRLPDDPIRPFHAGAEG